MLLSRILIFGFILLFLKICDDTDPCLEKAITDPYNLDIFVKVKLCGEGGASWENDDPDFPGFPEELQNKVIVITFYKKHCGGQLSRPMNYQYVIREKWIENQNLGIWSILVANKEEELIVDIKYEGAQSVAASRKLDYLDIIAHSYPEDKLTIPLYIFIKNGRLSLDHCERR
jgi:hypothetical protein